MLGKGSSHFLHDFLLTFTQYVILKSTSNTQSAIWVIIQASGALLGVIYWMVDPTFDGPETM